MHRNSLATQDLLGAPAINAGLTSGVARGCAADRMPGVAGAAGVLHHG
jgi:hypothetical protein